MSEELCSLRISAGTASVLGLLRARVDVKPTTAHVMLGEGCVRNCAFCAQAREAKSPSGHLSRVSWPEFPWREAEPAFLRALQDGVFGRVCVQTVECSSAPGLTQKFVAAVREMTSDMPLSVAVTPTSRARARLLLRTGATNIGLPIDAATPGIYKTVKGGSWEHAWGVLEDVSGEFPGRVTTHLIVGLGESEEDAVAFLVRAQRAGVTVGLFSFTPVKGSAMEDVLPPEVGSYRRVQIAAYHLKRGGDPAGIEISDGKIVAIRSLVPGFGSEVRLGKPFLTSGCSLCNRPYYNDRPGQEPLNYARSLLPDEASKAITDSGLF